MSTVSQLQRKLLEGAYDRMLANLYGADALAEQRERYALAAGQFLSLYGDREGARLYSAPGRTELLGNHTDHQHGRVLAASVDLDVIAVAAPSAERRIRIQSEGYPLDDLELADLAVRPEETNRSAALIRGTAARFVQLGYTAGGFDAYTVSRVPKGSGLSSSAAFEVLVGVILNGLYNCGSLSAVELARIAQYAENVYFGKPSGLMDQMASAAGGIVSIDFADEQQAVIRPVSFDLAAFGHRLCIVETGGSHADLTQEYAAVPKEMGAVAAALGVRYLRHTDCHALLAALPRVRNMAGDRAVLRALHFFRENERVEQGEAALRQGDLELFKRLMVQSGHSSFEYLQNVHAPQDGFQGLPLALCLAQMALDGRGAWRVHGGGFGGTILCLVPEDMADSLRASMEPVFGAGSCRLLRIRPKGGVRLDADAS